jgi:hypothetical protein
MTVIRFPRRPAAGPSGPFPIYVCAPSFEEMKDTKKKFGLGWSRSEARVAFYGGDSESQQVETRVFTLATAPGTLKFHVVHQLEIFVGLGQPLSDVEEEVRRRLGSNPFAYSDRGPSAPKRKRLDRFFR